MIDIDSAAAGGGSIVSDWEAQRARLDASPTGVYRFYDADDALLYVGIAKDPDARAREHARKPFFWFVRRRECVMYPNRAAAADAEAEAIRTEAPTFNRTKGTDRTGTAHRDVETASWWYRDSLSLLRRLYTIDGVESVYRHYLLTRWEEDREILTAAQLIGGDRATDDETDRRARLLCVLGYGNAASRIERERMDLERREYREREWISRFTQELLA